MNDAETTPFENTQFKKIVVASTALGLAFMIGSLASIRIGAEVGLKFVWHWSIPFWIAAVVLWNSRFWSVVWQTQKNPTTKTKRKLFLYIGLLAILGLGSFLYPIRFVEQGFWSDISHGLVRAVLFLGILFYSMFKVGRWFNEADALETNRQMKVLHDKQQP